MIWRNAVENTATTVLISSWSASHLSNYHGTRSVAVASDRDLTVTRVNIGEQPET